MRKFIIAISFTCIFFMNLSAEEITFDTFENALRKGDISYLEKLIGKNYKTDRINACKAFFKLKIKESEISAEDFLLVHDVYPKEFYGEKALLEAAKIEVLARNYVKALDLLGDIKNEKIIEKYFWLSELYLKTGEFTKSIQNAQMFITYSKDDSQNEMAQFFIVEAYIRAEKYQKALNTLNYIQNSATIENNIPCLHYKTGYCYEMLGNYKKTISYYRKLMLDFPYSKYSIMAERRLYDLKEKDKSISIVELNTNDKDIPDILYSQDNNFKKTNLKGYILQTGVFSSRSKAEKYASNMKDADFEPIVFEKTVSNKLYYAVGIGPFKTKNDSKDPAKKLKNSGYDYYLFENK